MAYKKEISSEVSDRIVTVQDLINQHNISLEEWEIERKFVNSWETSVKDSEGKLISKPNFQVKVWLSSKKDIKRLADLREEFLQELRKLSPKVKKLKQRVPKGIKFTEPKLLQINLFDLHLGKVSWKEETGSEYNIEIASKLFSDAIDHFIKSCDSYNVERILLPIGNDFFNVDKSHPFNSTTKGTPQEEDLRWQRTFRLGRELVVKNVNKLIEIAPVDIVMVPGNHDYEKNFFLGDSLEGWFHNNENVTVDNSANPRKYYNYKTVLIGFTHGNEEKIGDLPIIMAQENAELWSSTMFREFHLGHWHTRKDIKYISTDEYTGVRVRQMSSLSGADSWHHKKGYVWSNKSAEAFLWDSSQGLTANFYFNSR